MCITKKQSTRISSSEIHDDVYYKKSVHMDLVLGDTRRCVLQKISRHGSRPRRYTTMCITKKQSTRISSSEIHDDVYYKKAVDTDLILGDTRRCVLQKICPHGSRPRRYTTMCITKNQSTWISSSEIHDDVYYKKSVDTDLILGDTRRCVLQKSSRHGSHPRRYTTMCITKNQSTRISSSEIHDDVYYKRAVDTDLILGDTRRCVLQKISRHGSRPRRYTTMCITKKQSTRISSSEIHDDVYYKKSVDTDLILGDTRRCVLQKSSRHGSHPRRYTTMCITKKQSTRISSSEIHDDVYYKNQSTRISSSEIHDDVYYKKVVDTDLILGDTRRCVLQKISRHGSRPRRYTTMCITKKQSTRISSSEIHDDVYYKKSVDMDLVLEDTRRCVLQKISRHGSRPRRYTTMCITKNQSTWISSSEIHDDVYNKKAVDTDLILGDTRRCVLQKISRHGSHPRRYTTMCITKKQSTWISSSEIHDVYYKKSVDTDLILGDTRRCVLQKSSRHGSHPRRYTTMCITKNQSTRISSSEIHDDVYYKKAVDMDLILGDTRRVLQKISRHGSHPRRYTTMCITKNQSTRISSSEIHDDVYYKKSRNNIDLFYR